MYTLFLNVMTLIVDTQYFSPYNLIIHLSNYSHCIFDQYEHFQKMGFMNRCMVAGGNGPITLTVPLVGGRNQRTVVKDVKILETDQWQLRHWKTITSCYNKSPWFEHYSSELEALYRRRFTFLVDWNMACFTWLADKMSIRTSWSLSDGYRQNYPPHEYQDIRGWLKPSTIGAVFGGEPKYPQVFADRFGFIPNLSVLDYLFCAGPKV